MAKMTHELTRNEISLQVGNERERQYNLPGREFDMTNTPNDWVAIIGRYCFEETRRGAVKPTRANFEDSLVKAAAVIMAALQHTSIMEKNGHFAEPDDFTPEAPALLVADR